MVRIYARENATQRSKQSTAIDGSVLASVRWLARQLLGGISPEIRRYDVFESAKAFECAQGNLLSDKGIGQDLISRVLKDMPGMTRNSIGESLSRLKDSGHYARTLLAVQQQIEAEAEAARREAERLEWERLEAEARRFRRFRRCPWEVRQQRKLYKTFIPWPESCAPKGGKSCTRWPA